MAHLSLQATGADGFYNPPDWDPSKVSRDRYQGSKGANQYEQKGVIRFEMPWNVWCLTCDSHIGRGVRYNAKKDFVGKYFSTPLWRFTMKCHLCDGEMVIETAPEIADYKVVVGAKRRAVNYTATEEHNIQLLSESHMQMMSEDPMYRLQHEESEKKRALAEATRMDTLLKLQKTRERDYDNNSLLRRIHRDKRMMREALGTVSAKRGLAIELLPKSAKDKEAAAKVKFKRKFHKSSPSLLRTSLMSHKSKRTTKSKRATELHSLSKSKSLLSGSHTKRRKASRSRTSKKKRKKSSTDTLEKSERHTVDDSKSSHSSMASSKVSTSTDSSQRQLAVVSSTRGKRDSATIKALTMAMATKRQSSKSRKRKLDCLVDYESSSDCESADGSEEDKANIDSSDRMRDFIAKHSDSIGTLDRESTDPSLRHLSARESRKLKRQKLRTESIFASSMTNPILKREHNTKMQLLETRIKRGVCPSLFKFKK